MNEKADTRRLRSIGPIMLVRIADLKVDNHHNGFAVSSRTPRLSWRFHSTEVKGWRQAKYEVTITRSGKEECYSRDSSEVAYVPWLSSPLASREIAHIKVRCTGEDGSQTNWASLTIEGGLLERDQWIAKLISEPQQNASEPKRPFRLRKPFRFDGGKARLDATAHGIYQVEINGAIVGDQVLTPGWQSYHHRLYYQVYDVTDLLVSGYNIIGAYVGEGWFAGRLGRPRTSNIWGDRLGFLAQLEVDNRPLVITDESWEYLDGPVTNSEIYNGEMFDSTLDDTTWSTFEHLGQTLRNGN